MTQKILPSLSIFFPAYYDEGTIEELSLKAMEVARSLTDDYEIIIVDDCSPDKTGEIADRLSARFKEIRVIHHEKNKGVGGATISGYGAAGKAYVFYTDGDAQYDIEELKLLASHAGEHDAVIGYRRHRAEGFRRSVFSRLFNGWMFCLYGLNFKDIDCSFKLIRTDFLRKFRFLTNGGLVDAETLIRLKKLNARIKQVPVHHYARRFGSSRWLKRPGLILAMMRDMLTLRFKL